MILVSLATSPPQEKVLSMFDKARCHTTQTEEKSIQAPSHTASV
ncbi:Hypothetical protein CpCap5W_1890 [Corynebacterium pseudotuberculosis]|nr:Hypothetical protein Cp4202_0806 [Corynebacterium pseudotuberculosis 42/02-A]AEX39293.1 Hypothetical protein Cp3995_0828 [Corynebacterium pseudotuberculosis 3/99-5]AIG07200.1 hypothetical protein CPTA_01371 [Corynebacterium pseudotuberculosis]AIG08217.1 hypothetical protein CPTB_00161 [Corynebacterium pseudotuberculosis]AIG11649.1 hypothetical protein CPTC_01361 [Corynebacterium pseudotuberculosis]